MLSKEDLEAYHDNMVAEGMSSEAAQAVMEGLAEIKYDPKQSEPPKMSNSQQLTENAKGLEKIDAEIKHVEKEMEEQVNKYHRLLTDIEQCEATLEELDVKKKNAYQRKEEAHGDTAELVGAGKIVFKAFQGIGDDTKEEYDLLNLLVQELPTESGNAIACHLCNIIITAQSMVATEQIVNDSLRDDLAATRLQISDLMEYKRISQENDYDAEDGFPLEEEEIAVSRDEI